MRNRLFDLLARNKARGSFRADGSTIYLYDFIVDAEWEAEWFGGVSAQQFTNLLASLSGPLTLRVNSPGGSVFGGRVMAQAIRSYPDGIDVVIDGLAASAASYVALSGRSVAMAPGAFLMIHRSWGHTIGNAVDHRQQADVLEKIDGTIADSYVARAGGDREEWLERMNAETWFSAPEALELGLIDEAIAETRNSEAQAKWDVSAFANAPAPFRSAAPANDVPTNEPAAPVEAEPAAPVEEAAPDIDNREERIRRAVAATL